jgi:hypothetical protein
MRLQRFGQHPPGALTHQLVDQRRRVRAARVIGIGHSSNAPARVSG